LSFLISPPPWWSLVVSFESRDHPLLIKAFCCLSGNFHALWKHAPTILCKHYFFLLPNLSLSLFLSPSRKKMVRKVDIFGNDRPEFAPISSHKIWVALHQGNALEHEKKEREKRGGFHFILILATYIYLLIQNTVFSNCCARVTITIIINLSSSVYSFLILGFCRVHRRQRRFSI